MMKDYAQFVAITSAINGLYALDASGGVWHYIPANDAKETYAFWTKLTDHRADPAQSETRKYARRTPGVERGANG